MDVGLIIRYGAIVPGRETQAIELFDEATKYYEEKVAQKVPTHFEPFFFMTSDYQEETGFFILKGPAPEVFKLMEEEEVPLAPAEGRPARRAPARGLPHGR